MPGVGNVGCVAECGVLERQYRTIRPDTRSTVAGSFAWTRGALAASGWLPWLERLPSQLRLTLADGTRLLGVHASPVSDDDAGITPNRSAVELINAFAGVDADIVVAGYTHQPTDRMVGNVRAVNLGSVSNPITADLRASYVIVEHDSAGHTVEHRRVSYDHEAFIELALASGHPEVDYITSFQLGAQVRF
jgi:predicted phosphodiesterase